VGKRGGGKGGVELDRGWKDGGGGREDSAKLKTSLKDREGLGIRELRKGPHATPDSHEK